MDCFRLRTFWSAFVISSLMAVAFASNSWTGEDGQGLRTVTGEVLKISGSFAVVKGPNGKGMLDVASDTVILQQEGGRQVALRVSRETKQEGVIDAGDKVEASVAPDGHIVSIRPAQPAQTPRP